MHKFYIALIFILHACNAMEISDSPHKRKRSPSKNSDNSSRIITVIYKTISSDDNFTVSSQQPDYFATICERYFRLKNKGTIDIYLQSVVDIEPIVEQSIKILNKHLERPKAFIFSIGQSCAFFIFAAWALSNILKIGNPKKLFSVAFSGKYYCDTCCLTGENSNCTISHANKDFFFPTKEQIELFIPYLQKLNFLKSKKRHYIALDLVCNGSGLLSFIDLFKTIKGIQKNWTLETYIFRKKLPVENNMVQTLKNLGSEFLDYSIYKKHTKLFDMLSANEEDKNIRLVPEFYKHQWGTLDPLEFIPDERAQKMLMAIIHHIYSNKESLAKMIQN